MYVIFEIRLHIIKLLPSTDNISKEQTLKLKAYNEEFLSRCCRLEELTVNVLRYLPSKSSTTLSGNSGSNFLTSHSGCRLGSPIISTLPKTHKCALITPGSALCQCQRNGFTQFGFRTLSEIEFSFCLFLHWNISKSLVCVNWQDKTHANVKLCN